MKPIGRNIRKNAKYVLASDPAWSRETSQQVMDLNRAQTKAVKALQLEEIKDDASPAKIKKLQGKVQETWDNSAKHPKNAYYLNTTRYDLDDPSLEGMVDKSKANIFVIRHMKTAELRELEGKEYAKDSEKQEWAFKRLVVDILNQDADFPKLPDNRPLTDEYLDELMEYKFDREDILEVGQAAINASGRLFDTEKKIF